MQDNNRNLEHLHCHNMSDLFQDNHNIPLPILPIKMEYSHSILLPLVNPLPAHYAANLPKIIPDYNFQSLFRKKSHLRLARNKKKEEALKNNAKNGNCKIENSQKQTKHVKKGHWTAEQNRLYHWFLQIHSRHFILKHLRRTDKIFKSMATFIGTRQAQQCRSHHQKMQKKYHNFYHIIIKLRTQFYNTTTADLLRADLEENGYTITEHQIISEIELKNGEQNTHHSRGALQEEHSDSSISEHGRGYGNRPEDHEEHSDIMNENYENELDFKIQYEG